MWTLSFTKRFTIVRDFINYKPNSHMFNVYINYIFKYFHNNNEIDFKEFV